MTTEPTNNRESRMSQWEPHELEWLQGCPVCNSAKATVLHEGLKDYVFSAAGGQWRLMSCGECECAFLNPRPTSSTIGRAYSSYYTHAAPAPGGAALTGRAWIRRALANGYRNEVYGTSLRPSMGVLGCVTARLSRAFLNAIESEAPGLVRVRPKRPGSSLMLDVGCGSGLSLLRARDAGWRVMGVEPDDAAARTAKARGIDVVARHLHELTPAFDGTFERIMLSHVIEHVHDPFAMLRRCSELLAPGGSLWLETPNLSSLGHMEFGANWRGLEPPRHLVMFRSRPLEALLVRAGFAHVQRSEPRDVWSYMFDHSARIRQQRQREAAADATATAGLKRSDTLRHLVHKARKAVAKAPEQSEFLTLTATV